MIRTIGLSKSYTSDEIETSALAGVNMEITHGEMIAVMGPSGSGKSTLLNLLGLIDKPDSGDYYFEDVCVSGYNEKKRAELRKNNIGFIFQSFNLVNELTVYENIELPLLYTGMNSAARSQRIEQLLEQMKIGHRKDHYPHQLSGGQQQRVAVARAISNSPKVILADEPTGNLDSKNGDEVMKLLMQLNELGTTVIMVTHSMHYAQLCRRIIRLLDGQIVTEQVKREFYV